MLPTYTAVLTGDRLTWTGDTPVGIADTNVPVHVTLLAPPSAPADRGKRMAAALEELAARGGIAGIGDPLAWQREQRSERDLPGRSE